MIRVIRVRLPLPAAMTLFNSLENVPLRPLDGKIDLFFFTADQWEGEPHNRESEKCDEVAWFPADHLPDNTVEYLRHAIACAAKGEMLSEWGW